MKSGKAVICGFLTVSILFIGFPFFALGQTHKYVIAVLDFYSNMNDTKEDAMLQSGTADTIISDLMNIIEFKVIERTRLKDINRELAYQQSGMIDEATAQRIGKQLGAEYVIFGGWQKDADIYRLNARLVKVETAEVITSIKETDSRIFPIQDRIVKNIASTLKIDISVGALAKIETPETQSLEAYKEYSQGLKAVDSNDKEAVQQHMAAAVQIDPNYSKPKTYLFTDGSPSPLGTVRGKSKTEAQIKYALIGGALIGGLMLLGVLASKDEDKSEKALPYAGVGFGAGFLIGLFIPLNQVDENTDKSSLVNLGVILNPKRNAYGFAVGYRY
ncbi:MAG: CsgG/HfaB family protein [Acidobacteriota bacterium]|nr:CsgG/HfaB family protein [Acidobacteriota bacterium]